MEEKVLSIGSKVCQTHHLIKKICLYGGQEENVPVAIAEDTNRDGYRKCQRVTVSHFFFKKATPQGTV